MSVLHVVQVGCVQDAARRIGPALLDVWPTLSAVASAVAGAGARVTVLQAAHENARCSRDGVDFQFVAEPTLRRRNWAGLLPGRLARAAKALKPDVIHINGLGFPFHTRALCGVGAPVLVQDHAGTISARLGWLYRYGLAHADGFAFTAAEQATPFFRAAILRQNARIFAIPESSSGFTPGDKDAARAATGIEGDPALLWVGRLDANKDPCTILDAVGRAAAHRPGLQLWCCFHEAPLLERVRARLAADPILAARVHLLGRVPHLQIELLCRAADIFVLGSAQEGSGYALLEALACGLPPVVSDIPSFRQLTDGGRIGVLAPRGDAASFAAALIDIAPRSASLRTAARAHFEAQLSFPAIGRQLVAAYQALIAARAA